MGKYLIIDVFVDKNKNIILVPYKECKVGYALAVEPYKRIDNTEWKKVSIHIVELLEELQKQPIITEDTESKVMEQICGKQSYKQFSKKHICITVKYIIGEKKFKIYNVPRLSNGAYGTLDEISKMYSTEHICADDTALIQENFIKAYEEAERYLEKIGGRL